jgi:hypothetical protein
MMTNLWQMRTAVGKNFCLEVNDGFVASESRAAIEGSCIC